MVSETTGTTSGVEEASGVALAVGGASGGTSGAAFTSGGAWEDRPRIRGESMMECRVESELGNLGGSL